MSASGAFGSATVITGEDEYLRAQARREAIEATRVHAPHLSVVEIAAENANLAEVCAALDEDLFGTTSVVVLTGANKASAPVREALVAWCATASTSCALVVEVPKAKDNAGKAVVTALVKAGAYLVETVAPKAGDRKRFAGSALRGAGLSPDGGAEQMLAEGEADLRGIATRARQLASDLDAGASTRTPVRASDVASVVTSSTAISGFAVSDALLTRDVRSLSAALLAAEETGTASVLIISACLSALRDLAAVKSGRAGAMPSWKASKVSRHVRRWDSVALAAAFDAIGGAHPAVGTSGRRDADVRAALLRAASGPAPGR